MATGSYLSIITLNVNGLNVPTKRQRLAEWIQKQDPYICCLQENHFKASDTYRQKVKGWKKIFHANRDQKKAGVTILISDKIDFKIKTVIKDKEGHYIMIKGSIQEDITIVNTHETSMKSQSESHSVMSNSLQPHGLYSPWNSPGHNTGVGNLSLLQGIFPTQGSNPGLQQADSLPAEPQGKPLLL